MEISNSLAPVLADHFPRAPKDCKIQAQSFFSCFSTSAMKLNNNDTDAGTRGLQSCLSEKKIYDSCMYGVEKRVAPKRYRVQEEYRIQGE